ncbi:MAG: phosphatase PAP2 family protein, partial [Myxococcales bacterium]
NGSFFSNHTSSAMALATATSCLAFHRSRNSIAFSAPLFSLAGLVGYLRIASDNHYFTDVIAGAVFGGLCGAVFARAF